LNKIWQQFSYHPLGIIGLVVVSIFIAAGVYAPFLASNKPLIVEYDGTFYFPLFRYLFYPGFYTKRLDLFFNLLIFTLPLFLVVFFFFKRLKKPALIFLCLVQAGLFLFIILVPMGDPASDPLINREKQKMIQKAVRSEDIEEMERILSWPFQLEFKSDYAKLNLLVEYKILKEQNEKLVKATSKSDLSTLYQIRRSGERIIVEGLEDSLKTDPRQPLKRAELGYYLDKQRWLETESKNLNWMIMPLIRPFHWQTDAGGSQALNRIAPWLELTRINHKDLAAGLIFGIRISLVVGILSVTLALAIGVPLGSAAGYFGGKLDILLSRLLEIWESMPIFFMLLLVVGIVQSKSIFLVMSVIGLFGWTGFSRYIRGEFFKQRNLPYVEACRAQGFSNSYIMFRHVLPNAIPPLLTLLPFAVMGAITSEAGLSFLGLGEEGSCSWGVLMDEGRTAFPGQSYLLWPPAIILTVLLVAIALMGDALRDSIDPKLHRERD
jgi:peptide/nickel transport system permease protein